MILCYLLEFSQIDGGIIVTCVRVAVMNVS